jgi:hypothetical protein
VALGNRAVAKNIRKTLVSRLKENTKKGNQEKDRIEREEKKVMPDVHMENNGWKKRD